MSAQMPSERSSISFSPLRRKSRRPDSRNSVGSLSGNASLSIRTSDFLSQAVVSDALPEGTSTAAIALSNSLRCDPTGSVLARTTSSSEPATNIAGFDASVPFRKTEFSGQGPSKDFEEEHWSYHKGEMIYNLRAYCDVANQLHAIYQREQLRALTVGIGRKSHDWSLEALECARELAEWDRIVNHDLVLQGFCATNDANAHDTCKTTKKSREYVSALKILADILRYQIQEVRSDIIEAGLVKGFKGFKDLFRDADQSPTSLELNDFPLYDRRRIASWKQTGDTPL
jgi:hypothetical protein